MFSIALHLCTYGYKHKYQKRGKLWKWYLENMATSPLQSCPTVLKDIGLRAGQPMTLETTSDGEIVLSAKKKILPI
jgi:hypothetical protein